MNTQSFCLSFIPPVSIFTLLIVNLFNPSNKDCYQDMQVLQAMDEIELKMDRVTLVTTPPVLTQTQHEQGEILSGKTLYSSNMKSFSKSRV